MNVKIIFYSVIGLFLTFVFSSCSQSSNNATLKIAHSLSTDHPVHKAIVYMADQLDKHSNGTMKMDIYPGGQLGDERELIELLQIGSLAMTKVSSSPLEEFIEEMKIFSTPYLFEDNDHFWRTLSSDIGRQILLSGKSVYLRGLGYYDAGSRSFYTVKKPVNSPTDLKGMKIRVQQSQSAIQMVNGLGGNATPIAWGELYTALQQGVVDGAENNPPSFWSSKHYEVAKNYTLDEHTMVPDIILIGQYTWDHLAPQQQIWLQQAMDESVIYQRQLWNEATQQALDEVAKAGVSIIHPDKKPFQLKAAQYNNTANAQNNAAEQSANAKLIHKITSLRNQSL